MAKTVEKLTGVGVPKLKKPGMYNDGEGLYFRITPRGSRSWILRFMLRGQTRDMGLGVFPAISLATARDLAREARSRVKQGIDPIKEKDEAAAESKAAAANSITFSKAAAAYIDEHKASWANPKSESQWTNTIETYCRPIFKDAPVSAITREMVLEVFKRDELWAKKTDTAKKLRGRIEMVFDWCKTKGYRAGENPARWKGHLSNLLPSPEQIRERGHFEALPYTKMAAFMPKLWAMDGIAAEALQFTILTAARSNMVRGARWDEIDWEKRIWTCPAERMKGKKGQRKEHRTPLSDAAMAILKARFKLKKGPCIFPGRNGKPMSDMSLTAVLRRMKQKTLTVHGFRSSFSDWAYEETHHTPHVIEMALAHKVGDDVETAYRRGDMFKKRVAIMVDWAKYCGL